MTGGNQTYCDHFVKYRNTKSLCCAQGTNIMWQINNTSKKKKKPDNLVEKEIRLVVTTRCQKVQTLSYKINSTREVMHDVINIINTAVCYT